MYPFLDIFHVHCQPMSTYLIVLCSVILNAFTRVITVCIMCMLNHVVQQMGIVMRVLGV